MKFLFNFGETVEGFDYKVINERDARASAGIMFLLGLLSLFSVFLLRTLFWAELFSITFIFEFFFRIIINPKYAPYMLIGNLIVSNQEPDWVEAKPKRFAWILGMILGSIMAFYILFDVISPIRIATCWLCLFLLYLESVFGICLGCLLYKKLNWKIYKCPGGVCKTNTKKQIDKKNIIYIILFIILFYFTYNRLINTKYKKEHKITIINDK